MPAGQLGIFVGVQFRHSVRGGDRELSIKKARRSRAKRQKIPTKANLSKSVFLVPQMCQKFTLRSCENLLPMASSLLSLTALKASMNNSPFLPWSWSDITNCKKVLHVTRCKLVWTDQFKYPQPKHRTNYQKVENSTMDEDSEEEENVLFAQEVGELALK